jgi:hypothetical protein
MSITTYEGVVEKGKIRLKSDVKLPENVRVYVIVPEVQTQEKKTAQIHTPRLTHRKQARDFKMKVGKA